MARLPALLDLMTDLGVAERRTLEVYARKLREAGLISEGRKGAGAAHVTPRDAAVIVLATMATDSPSAGPELVTNYSGLRTPPSYYPNDSAERKLLREAMGLEPDFKSLNSSPTLIEALESLVSNSPKFWRPQVFGMLDSKAPNADGFVQSLRARYVRVEFNRARPKLKIEIKDEYDLRKYDGDISSTVRKYNNKVVFDRIWQKTWRFGDDPNPKFDKKVYYDGSAFAEISELILKAN